MIQTISQWAPYKKGAFDMYMRLRELFEGEANVYDKAIFKMLEDSATRERFLEHDFQDIIFKNHKYKGKKLVSVEACLGVWNSQKGWHEGSLKQC